MRRVKLASLVDAPCRCRTLGLLIVVGAADAAGLDPAVVAADQLGHAGHRLIKGRRLDRDVGGIDDLFRILGRDIALFGPGPGCGCRCVRGWNRGKTVGLVRRHLGSRIAFKIVVGGISLHGQRYRTGCCGSTSRSRRATAASVQPPGVRKCEPFFSLYTSVSNHRLQLLGSMDTTPISAFCRCAEVELSSRLQIMAPRIMRERNTCKRNIKRPQCLDEGQTASLGAHGTNCLGAPDFGFLHLRGSGAELSPSDYGAAHICLELVSLA